MHSRRLPLAYRIVMVVATPFVRWWGRLEVTGTHLLDDPRPVVVFGNHDRPAGLLQSDALASARICRLGAETPATSGSTTTTKHYA